MRGRKRVRTVPVSQAASDVLDRLQVIGGAGQVRTESEARLRTVLTQTASALFKPEELPRYLQVQLAGKTGSIPSWENLTGERLTHLGLARHPEGVRADECGTLILTLVPVTIDYVAQVEGREVCSSAAYDPRATMASFEDGIHRIVMTAPELTVTRSAFPHGLMDLPFVQVTFRLRNTSDQFHAVTLVLLIKPFDEVGITSLERFSFSHENLIMLNGQRVAFACERPSSTKVSVYDPRTGSMVDADAGGEVVSPTGLMQLRLAFDHQLEPGGDTEVTFFFFVDRDRTYKPEELTLLLGQSAGILEQEHRLVVTQEKHVGYRTGDERLNRFAANQLLHLSSLEATASSAFEGGLDAVALPALVEAYDRVGEVDTASSLLRSYVAQLPAGPALSADALFSYASLVIALGWHLKVARQVQLRRQLFPVVDQFVTWLSQSQTTVEPVAIGLLGPLRRSGPVLQLVLGKAIESYQSMLSEKDDVRLRLCDDLQLRLLKQADAADTHVGPGKPTFADIAPIAAYALFGAHGTEDAILTGTMSWIAEHWLRDGFVANPSLGSLGDIRLSLLCAKTLVLRRESGAYGLMQEGLEQLGVSDALPDYIDLHTRRALAGPRHSAVATALALELLASLIFVERGTYLSIIPVPIPELFAGDGIDVHGLQSTFGELSVRMQRLGDKVRFSMRSDFLRGVSAIELNFPWELKELVARKGTVKYVTGGTIVMEPADLIEGEAVAANPGPS
ncbi:MAG TPA: hypothetical protein VFB98_06215 [Candidatus Deferrimicrobium sp.]|nr:hypothetical protein [Candidatus Deferrimicrobium sp.]